MLDKKRYASTFSAARRRTWAREFWGTGTPRNFSVHRWAEKILKKFKKSLKKCLTKKSVNAIIKV